MSRLTPREERDLIAIIPRSTRWNIVSERIIEAIRNGGQQVLSGITGFFSNQKQAFDKKMYEITIRSINKRLEKIYDTMHNDFEKFAGDWSEVKPNYLEFVRVHLTELQTLFADFYHCMGRDYKQYRSFSHYVRFLIDVFCSDDGAGTDLFDTASISEQGIEEHYTRMCQGDLEMRTEGSYEPGSFLRMGKKQKGRRSRSSSRRRSRSRSRSSSNRRRSSSRRSSSNRRSSSSRRRLRKSK